MLKVYGHPASQPSRAVIWACVINGLPIELHPDPSVITGVNPRGQIPAIDDGGFVLSEMPAILAYLADKYGWEDLYPIDLQVRARINSYLHGHHCLARLLTMRLMAPNVLVAFGGLPSANPLSFVNNTCIQESMSNTNGLAEGQALANQVIDYIEENYLSNNVFLSATEHPTISDIACYEEISQLAPSNLLDFSGKHQITSWMKRMQKLPHHDSLHRFNFALGDIKTESNTMERFVSAIGESMNELTKLDGVVLA